MRKSACRATWAGAIVVLLSLVAAPRESAATPATPFLLNIEQVITWIPPDPILPGDPIQPTDIFDGQSAFACGSFLSSGEGTSFFARTAFGQQSFSTSIHPPNPIRSPLIPVDPCAPAEALVWQFAGLLASEPGDFVTGAFLPSAGPQDPIIPLITIATGLTAGFAPIHFTGPIYAFDDPVQIGIWEIRITQVPEPGSLALLAIGLAALIPLTRRKATARHAT